MNCEHSRIATRTKVQAKTCAIENVSWATTRPWPIPVSAPTSSAVMTIRTANVRLIFQLVSRLGMMLGNMILVNRCSGLGRNEFDHLTQLRRNALHRVEAIDYENRCAHDTHHEEDAELDALEPQDREHYPAHPGDRHQQPTSGIANASSSGRSEASSSVNASATTYDTPSRRNPQHRDDDVVHR